MDSPKRGGYTEWDARGLSAPTGVRIFLEGSVENFRNYSKEKSRCIVSLSPFFTEKWNGKDMIGRMVIKFI